MGRLCRGRLCRGGSAGAILFGLGLEDACEGGSGLVESADEAGSRGQEDAEQLGEENLARRELSDGLDLLAGNEGAVDDAELDDGLLEFADEGLDDLCGGGDVLVAHDDGSLALKVAQLREAGILGGTAEEGVLDDVTAGAGIGEPGAELAELIDAEAGVIGDELEGRGVELRQQFFDDVKFFGAHGW